MAASEVRALSLEDFRFQSLFWWIGDGGLAKDDFTAQWPRVSILVLVDWRWRPSVSRMTWLDSTGFNPCSGGLEMAARLSVGADSSPIRVSILVLVDWRWRRPKSPAAPARAAGFNPCSGGLEMAALHHYNLKVPYHVVSILVLVDWRWRPGWTSVAPIAH